MKVSLSLQSAVGRLEESPFGLVIHLPPAGRSEVSFLCSDETLAVLLPKIQAKFPHSEVAVMNNPQVGQSSRDCC